MNNNIIKKRLVMGIIVLFLGTSILPIINGYSVNRNLLLTKNYNNKIPSYFNSDVIDSKNIWEKFNEDGFGNFTNLAFRGVEVFNDSLIVGTANYNNDSIFSIGKAYTPLYIIINTLIHVYIKKDDLRSFGCEVWSYNYITGWKQLIGRKEEAKMEAGFGNKNNTEIGVLIKFKDYLYAGVKNSAEGCQIWRTKSIDEEWELVADKGLGNKKNMWFMEAEIFNDQLYFGTFNYDNGCEIFRTSDGKNWEIVVGGNSKTKNGFGTASNFYCWSLEVYDGYLYAGTLNYVGGGEIWRSKDGTSWEPVIAYITRLGAKLHGADYPRGFDPGISNYRGGIRNMIVYNGELYVALTAEDKRFCVTLPLIGKFLSFGEGMFMSNQIRRFNSYGLDIFKYNSTKDKWTKVVGGLFRGNASSGFGDYRNEYPWSMIVHGNYLYVGTLRINAIEFFISRLKFLRWGIGVNLPTGGGELWRFDGTNWEQINNDGFGDKYNVGIRELTVYNNYLMAFTMNVKDGCEAWKYDLN